MSNIVPIRETNPAPLERQEITLAEAGERIARMEAAVLEMGGLLRQVLDALGNTRVTRSQERAITVAIRARARALREREGLPASAERRIASEIRRTLRQATGCRAAGDIPSRQFDRALALVAGWDMTGALRRIRRECNG